MKQLQGAGPRNMPWAEKAVVCEGEGTFVFTMFQHMYQCLLSLYPKLNQRKRFITCPHSKMKETHMFPSCLYG